MEAIFLRSGPRTTNDGDSLMESATAHPDVQTICVVIAAKNAADTIATAVRSALQEALVSDCLLYTSDAADE